MMDYRTEQELKRISMKCWDLCKGLFEEEKEDPPGMEGATNRGRDIAEHALKQHLRGNARLSPMEQRAVAATLKSKPRLVTNPRIAREYERCVEVNVDRSLKKGILTLPDKNDPFLRESAERMKKIKI